MTRKAQLELEAAIAAVEQARDAGNEYFHAYGDFMLVEVARHAATLFAVKQHQIAFLQGYSAARAHHEAFERGE
jgi:hypothetical protein